MKSTYNKKGKGFTLIEMLIVISILGIVAAIAVPSYGDYVKKSRRKEAQTDLMNISNAMERFFTVNNTYATASLGSGGIYPDASPLDGDTKYYSLAISSATATSYTLRATPRGSQAGNGRLEVDSTGTKIWNSKDDGSGTNHEW